MTWFFLEVFLLFFLEYSMSVINTNYLSLVSQNNLAKSQSALGSAIERLSSGMRINSAKDDSAGQAIANRFTSSIKGLTQAARNANDGVSLAQTAEGALNEINSNLQRVRELTVQAQNETLSASDIDSIQQEVNERFDEIKRVTEQTEFNGFKVLAGDGNNFSIQVGSRDDQTIDIKMADSKGWDLASANAEIATTDLAQINGEARQVAAKGIDVRAAVTVTPAVYEANTTDLGKAALQTALRTDTNNFEDDVTVGNISFKDGQYEVALTSAKKNSLDGSYTVTVAANGALTIGSKLGAATADATVVEKVQVETTPAKVSAVSLKTLDDALNKVDTQRSDLGAIQNRFESSIANLNNTVTNLSAARSRIEDADYAVEVSNMTRAQILQQAGTNVLSRANQVPQGVMSLLQ